MMMLITPSTTILVLLMFVALQMVMILESEIITKYVVSMRNHGNCRAPTYTALTTTISTVELNFQSRTNDSDDNYDSYEDHGKNSARKPVAFFTDSKEHHNCNMEYKYDRSFCPRYPEP